MSKGDYTLKRFSRGRTYHRQREEVEQTGSLPEGGLVRKSLRAVLRMFPPCRWGAEAMT